MSLFRLAALPLIALALAAPTQAATTALKAPTDVHGFLAEQRSGDPTFSRTPSFAWNAVRGAAKYEFALSTSPLFSSSGLVWDDATLTSPVAAVPISLPWITGNPHSLYARVRAIASNGAVGPWSTFYGFDMRWSGDGIPAPLPAADGLVRWTPIPGATGYEVWYLNTNLMGSGKSKIFSTTTNSADEREYYTFHSDPSSIGTVSWRVRAERRVDFTPNNKLPTVSYGPWSPVYTSTNSTYTTGELGNLDTVAEPAAAGHDPAQDGFQLMPAFTFTGNTGLAGVPTQLFRVYIFSDADCVNPVWSGALVGSPAYVPRTSGPVKLPATTDELAVAQIYDLLDGPQTTTSSTGDNVVPTEGTSPSTFNVTYITQPSSGSDGSSSGSGSGSGSSGGSSSGGSSSGGSSSGSGTGSTSSSSTGIVFPSSIQSIGSPIDLWDTNWPKGTYYWTVIPVAWAIAADPLGSLTPPTGGGSGGGSAGAQPLVYFDAEIPQDACQDGRLATFGKASMQPVTGDPATRVPFVWGLTPSGKLRAATKPSPKVYGAPLVAWQPALAASAYEVQWSRTLYPWRPQGNLYTFATSTTLQLKPGKWFYRVRGIDFSLPSAAPQMAWSNKIQLVVAKPAFKVVKK